MTLYVRYDITKCIYICDEEARYVRCLGVTTILRMKLNSINFGSMDGDMCVQEIRDSDMTHRNVDIFGRVPNVQFFSLEPLCPLIK